MSAGQTEPRAMLERRSERRRIGVKVRYRRKVVRLVAQVNDISCHGIRLASMERLAEGDTVWLSLPGLEPRRAIVVWSERFEAGCKFAEPLHPAILDAIVHGRIG